MAATQLDKAIRFRRLHEGPGIFVMPGPWDAGSARLLASLGFEALATSSAASAGVLGKRDGEVTRDEAMAHVRAIAGATDLPLSADLEKGFGDAPADTAEAIRLGAEAGLVGGSIEDAGVQRISLATSLCRAAMAGLREAAQEVRQGGTFGYLERL